MVTRRNLEAIHRSGLSSLLERYTFATWQQRFLWQSKVEAMAREYIALPEGRWFMISGRPGTGKTHICTALCGEMMQCGRRVRYALWRDFSVLAKAVVNNEEEYRRIVEPLKAAQVLYIDDFFKAGRDEAGRLKITPADINLAFEIVNARYNDTRKLTVISTEISMGELLGLDEAVGSRIYERTKAFYLPLGDAENWRLG